METSRTRTLKLIAGWLCLDFANTAGMHASERTNEFLRSYFDLAEWSNHAGIISGEEERRLLRKAEETPTEAVRVHQRAIELRETIFNIFSSIARAITPPKKEMDKFNRKLSRMMKHSKLEFHKEGVTWDVRKSSDSLDGMFDPIIQSAFKLLTSNELDRVKICADERGCGWLFFDRSKNRSRRWCDMRDCGNLAKQKRFYRRSRNQEI